MLSYCSAAGSHREPAIFISLVSLLFLLACDQPRDADSSAAAKPISSRPTSEVTMTIEMLIVLDEHAPALTRRHLAGLTTKQRVSDLVCTASLDEAQREKLRELPGVRVFPARTPPESLPNHLTATEQLFAQAWLLQQEKEDTQRRGQGLDWDDPDYVPPDSLR